MPPVYEIPQEYRRGRYVVSALHIHLVFVTKYRRGVLDADMLRLLRGRHAEGLQRHRRGEMGHEVLEAYTEVKATQPYRSVERRR